MPTVPMNCGRFAEIVAKGQPPFYFDPGAVAALEPRGES